MERFSEIATNEAAEKAAPTERAPKSTLDVRLSVAAVLQAPLPELVNACSPMLETPSHTPSLLVGLWRRLQQS